MTLTSTNMQGPMYRQIANAIRQKIRSGEYKVGSALPTEAQLREYFSCSRVTVRQALKLLIENNELESVQGSGTYVIESKVNYDIEHQSSFAEKWLHLDAHTHSEVLEFKIQPASLTMAEWLNINEKDQVYYVRRVRFRDEVAITVEETWLPVALFPDLSYQVMQQSKYHYIEVQKGLVIDRSEQELVPVLPATSVAELLDIDVTKPIIEKRTRGYLDDGTVFEFSRNYFKPAEYKFTLVAYRQPARK